MKPWITIFCFLVVNCDLFLLNAQENEENRIKILTYNIWNGFDWGKDTTRKSEAFLWIHQQNPDIVALQELNNYTAQKLEEDAKAWGHAYSVLLKESGYAVGITANKPIELKARIMENMHHGALHCKTWDMDIFVVHFSPSDYEKRMEEADTILSRIEKLGESDKLLVLGDFNALSPFDYHLYLEKKELMKHTKTSQEQNPKAKILRDGHFDFSVISKFMGFPLIDVVERFNQSWEEKVSFPTKVFEDKKGDPQALRSQRIDYIFVSPYLAAQCLDARVENGDVTAYLSDHYPVIAEFLLE